MVIRLANGKFVVIDGRETAPSGARHDMYVIDGKADTRASKVGALASGIRVPWPPINWPRKSMAGYR